MSAKLIFCLFSAFLALVHSAPLTNTESQCAKQCSEVNNFFYEIGKTYNYKFNTKTELKYERENLIASIEGIAKLNYARKCEFKLKLENVKVEGVPNKAIRADELEKEILTFAFDDGLIRNVCPSLVERSDVLNIKKAILSAMQVSVKDLGSQNTVDERDVLGDCETIYEEINAFNKQSEGTKLKKTKILNTCRNRMHSNTDVFQNKILNRFLEKSVDLIQNEYTCYQYIDNDGILKSVDCRETSQTKQSSSESTISMHYVNVDNSIFGDNKVFKIQSLLHSKQVDQIMDDRKSIELLSSLCYAIRDDVSNEAPKYFHRFIESLRGLNKDQISQIIEKSKNGFNGCSANKINGLINSALLYSGGNGALDYISEQMNTMTFYYPCRKLLINALPFVSNINEDTIKIMNKLMHQLRSPKDLLFISSLIGNYVRSTGSTDSVYVNEAVHFLDRRLANKCYAPDSKNEETVITLKSIANIGYAPSSVIDKLIKCSKSSETSTNIRVAALDALRRVDACSNGYELSNDVNLLLSLLRKKSEESDEIKIAAFKTLMSCSKSFGDDFVVEESKKILKDDNNKRLAHYVYSYLKNIKKSKTPSMNSLRSSLRNEDFSFFKEDKQEKYSKNVLYSHYSKALQMGIDFEIDYIFEEGLKNPKSIIFSMIAPIHKQRVQIFEIGLRQESNDESLSEIIELIKAQTFENMYEILKASMFGFDTDSRIGQTLKSLDKAIVKFVNSLSHVSFYINYNENTLFIEDKSFPERKLQKRESPVQSMRPMFEKLSEVPIVSQMKSLFEDSAVASLLVDSSIEISTVSGLPIVFSAKSSLISTRNEVKDIETVSLFPNFGIGLCLSMKTYVNRYEQRGIKWKTHFISNLDLWLKIGNQNKEKSIELRLPKQKTNLIQYSSFVAIDTDSSEKVLSREYPNDQICSKDLFGLVLCASKSFSKFSDSQKQNFEVTLFKTNQEIEGWKAAIALPETDNNRFFVHFSTPGFNEYYFDMEVEEKIETIWKKYHLTYRTPKQNLEGLFAFYNVGSTLRFLFEYNLNGQIYMYELQHKPKFEDGNQMETIFLSKTPKREIELKSTYTVKENSVELDITSEIMNNKYQLLHLIITGNAEKKSITFNLGESKLNQWIYFSGDMKRNNMFESGIDTNIEYKSKQMTKPVGLSLNAIYNRINDIKLTIHELSNDRHLALLRVTEGLFTFQVDTEKLKHKTIWNYDSSSAQFTTETIKNEDVILKGFFKRSDGKTKQIIIEIPDKFYLTYDLTDDNKHHFKVSHMKYKFVHETSYWKKDDSEVDFRSKSLHGDNEIHDIKLFGKYESTDKYNFQTSFNVMKRLRFSLDAKSSQELGKLEMKYSDSLFSPANPVKYGIRALRSAPLQEHPESKDIIKGIPTEDNSILVDFNFPYYTGELEMKGKTVKLVINELLRKNYPEIHHVHEFTITNIDRNNNEFTIKKSDSNGLVYLLKRQASPTLRHFELTADKKTMKLTFEKGEEKHKSIRAECYDEQTKDGRKASLNWAPTGDDVDYDLKVSDLNNKDLYTAKLKITEVKKYNFKAHFESTVHETKCNTKADLEVKNYDYNLEQVMECETSGKYTLRTHRKVTPNNYEKFLRIESVVKEVTNFIEIDTKAEKSNDGNSASIKSLVTSSYPEIDGSYLDYKRNTHSNQDERKLDIEIEFYPKPIDAKLNLKAAGHALMTGRYIKVPKELKLDVEATATAKGSKLIYDFDFESLPKMFRIHSKYSEEKDGVNEVIHTSTLHHDAESKLTYLDRVYNPTKSYYNISTVRDKNVEIVFVHRDTKIIDLRVDKTVETNSKRLETKGSLLGFSFHEVDNKEADKETVEFSVNPVAKDYPYQIPVDFRISDCYEPSNEPCISYTSVFDKSGHLSTLKGKWKIDRSGKKYTLFIEYERKDDENKHEKILTIKNDKDDTKLGFHSLSEDTDENHRCDLKIFLNKGRVIRFAREGKNMLNGKTEMWLDAERKPDQKLTITKVLNAKEDNYEFNLNINHPTFKKPIVFKADLVKISKDIFTGKFELDYSEDPNNKVHLDVEVKKDKESPADESNIFSRINQKEITSGKIYTEDKRIDLSTKEIKIMKFDDLETYISLFKSTEWKSVINPSEIKSELFKYDVKRIVEDNGVRLIKHFIFKRLSYYFEMDTEVFNSQHEPAVNNFDLVFVENGPKYRINSTTKSVEGGECLKLNGFKLVQDEVVGPKTYLDICFIHSPEKVVEISAGSDDFPKSVDAKIAQKSKDVYLVTVNWNPERIKSRLIDLLAAVNDRIKHYQQVEKEYELEREKMLEVLLTPMYNEVLEPFGKHIGNELSDTCSDNPLLCAPVLYIISFDFEKRSKRSIYESEITERRISSVAVKYSIPKFELITFDASKGELIFEIRRRH